MESGFSTCTAEQFEDLVAGLQGGVPDAALYQRMTTMMLETPGTRRLTELDPFSPDYHATALDLYLSLRGHPDEGYMPERDEVTASTVPDHVWSQLMPWSFHDPAMVGTHLYAWGHIMQHMDLAQGGSVLEYGPGSGQFLLMLARMGFAAFGVDVDAVTLEGIRLQAEGMRLPVAVERAVFGEGFEGERFDRIVFYEAFHHAIDFQSLLRRLHDRLKPGGRVILCGEPVVPDVFEGVPYPWGPRLDALSVFSMRRFGWMELGFTHEFFMEAARRAGWQARFHPFPGCGRAHVYVLEPGPVVLEPDLEPTIDDVLAPAPMAREPEPDLRTDIPVNSADSSAGSVRLHAELQAMRTSTSWRVTRPLRLVGRLLGRG